MVADSRRWLAPWLLVIALGAAALILHAVHDPLLLHRDFVIDAGLSWPRFDKTLAFVHALGGLFVIDAAALAVGHVLLRPSGLTDRRTGRLTDLAIPAQLMLGLLILAYAVFLLAALHILVEPALIALFALPIVALAPRAIRRLRAASLPRPSRRAFGLGAALALVMLAPLFDAFVPRYGWDALTYHLGLAERYLYYGRIYFTPFSLYNAFPLPIEMLYASALALGGGALAKLINLQFGVLVLWTLGALARRRSPRAAWFAIAIVLADPLFQWELGVAYNDLPLCLCALLATAAAGEWLAEPSRATLLRLAIFGGACVEIRVPGALVPVAIALVVTVAGRRHGARVLARLWLLVLGGCVLALSPWLVRNAIYTGDPFSPALQSLFGKPYFDPFVVTQNLAFNRDIGVGHSLRALVTLPWTLFVTSAQGLYTGAFGFAVGPLYLVAAVAALAVAEARRDALYGRALAIAGVMLLGWFATSQEARYLLPALLLAALAGGVAFDALAESVPSPARVALWLVLVAGVAVVQAPAAATLGDRFAVALGDVDPARVEEATDVATLAEELRANLPPDSRLMLLLESRSFYFHGLDFVPYHILEGSLTLRLIHDAPDAHALRCRLVPFGITHVVVNLDNARRFHPLPLPAYGAADYVADLGKLQSFLRAWSVPMAQRGNVIAARLQPVDDCR